jgi:hypothetical protein
LNNLFTYLKNKVIIILSGIAAILGILFLYEKSKRNSADALLENQESKKQVQEIQSKIDINNAALLSEEEKRNDIKAQLEKDKNETTTINDIINIIDHKS